MNNDCKYLNKIQIQSRIKSRDAMLSVLLAAVNIQFSFVVIPFSLLPLLLLLSLLALLQLELNRNERKPINLCAYFV